MRSIHNCAGASMSMMPSSSSSSSSSLQVLVSLRGGAADAVFDLERATIRLESLNAYGVVAALLLSAALRLYASTPKELEEGRKYENATKMAFIILVGVSIICGAYSCVVYSMLGLYSKTALGMGLEGMYVPYFLNT